MLTNIVTVVAQIKDDSTLRLTALNGDFLKQKTGYKGSHLLKSNVVINTTK